jgi:hypothetical protein
LKRGRHWSASHICFAQLVAIEARTRTMRNLTTPFIHARMDGGQGGPSSQTKGSMEVYT